MATSLQVLEQKITTRGFSEAGGYFCIKHRESMSAAVYSLFGEKPKTKWFCHACSQEQEKEMVLSAERQRAEQDQDRINKRIQNAMITPRFSEKSFDNFSLDNVGQGKALESCRRFLSSFERSPGLIFTGKPGTGKNHLACALVRAAIQEKNKTALITTAMKMIRAIKESWGSEGTEKNAIQSFIVPDLLVIDEVGVQFGSDTEKLYLTEIINDRYEWMKPTIILTNMPMNDLEKMLGERVIDRFREGGQVVVFDWDSYRRRANRESI